MARFEGVTYEAWRRRVESELGDEPFDSLRRTSPGGVELEPLYAAAHTDGAPLAAAAVGRGTLCPAIEAPTPEQAGDRLADELAGGAESVWLRLDFDSRLARGDAFAGQGAVRGPARTEPLAAGGVPMHHGSDLAAFLRRHDTAGLSELWVDAGGNALPFLAAWLCECERSGRALEATRLHLAGDPLASLARDGALPRDLMKTYSEAAAVARFLARQLPGSTALAVSTRPYHEAGAEPAQELGFLAAGLVEHLRALSDSGLEPADAARMISLEIAVDSRVFEEIAKLRAARQLFRAVLGAHGVEDPARPRLHAVGSQRSLTLRSRELNVLRGTEQAFAAICGGADAVSLWGYDRGSGISGSMARRLARNTHLVLDHEGHLARVEDPAAGSWFVESLTHKLTEAGWELAQEIERRGGMRQALLDGTVGGWVGEAAERRHSGFGRRAYRDHRRHRPTCCAAPSPKRLSARLGRPRRRPIAWRPIAGVGKRRPRRCRATRVTLSSKRRWRMPVAGRRWPS